MTWQWVTILFVVVLAWTVHKVTQMWQQVAMFRYSTDEVKKAIVDATMKGLEQHGNN